MISRLLTIGLTLMLACACAARKPKAPATPDEAKSKIKFNLSKIDKDGLVGPENGKRAVAYEFCIPGGETSVKEVQGIDPTIEITRGARGRVGCTPEQALAIGSTHQKNFADVLTKLSMLPYVKEIREAVFER
jgi:hypothetical protein